MSGEKESDWISKVREVGLLRVNTVAKLLEKSTLLWAVFSYFNGKSTEFKFLLPLAG